MRYKLRIVVMVAVATLVAVALGRPGVALAHPADGYTPRDPMQGYGGDHYGFGPQYNFGDLRFNQDWPQPSELTNAEPYMIEGTLNGPRGYGFLPWVWEIRDVALAYYLKHGSVPPVLTPEVIRDLAQQPDQVTQERIDTFRSPITNDFPRLDASGFSPGQVYIRPLTDSEIAHIGAVSPYWHKLLVEHEDFSPRGGGWQRVTITPPLFVRFYGTKKIVYDGIFTIYNFASDECQ